MFSVPVNGTKGWMGETYGVEVIQDRPTSFQAALNTFVDEVLNDDSMSREVQCLVIRRLLNCTDREAAIKHSDRMDELLK